MPSPHDRVPPVTRSVEDDAASFKPNRVLIVDADAEATEVLATLLRLSSNDITTACAHTPRDAVAVAQDFRPDVAIIDLGPQPSGGVVVAGAILAVCAGGRPLMIALAASRLGVDGTPTPGIFDHVLAKPLELRLLMGLIAGGTPPARH